MQEEIGQISADQRDGSVGCGRRIEDDLPGWVPHIGGLYSPALSWAAPPMGIGNQPLPTIGNRLAIDRQNQ